MKIFKPLWLFSLIFFISLASGRAEIIDRIVAQVNNEIITLSELTQMIKYMQSNPQTGGRVQDNEATRRQMLDILIDRKLAKEEANRLGISVPQEKIDQALEQIKQKNNFPDDEALARALAKEGMTVDQLRQQITEKLQQDQLIAFAVKGKVTVSDEDIRRYYQDHYRQGANQVHLKIIALPYPQGATAAQKAEAQAQAEKIYQECRRGASFEKLAREYSKAPNAPQGGDMGYINLSDLDPRLANFVDRLRPGEVAPVKTPGGFQIIKLAGRRTGHSQSLEEVKPRIKQILMQQEMAKKFSAWIKELRKKALIKILL